MSEELLTGEMTHSGYEYPIICPLDICGSGPIATSFLDGKWQCDECGKVVIYWRKDDE